MKSVSTKPSTFRRAVAVGQLRAAEQTIERMKSNDLPKKDVLVVARVAAVGAVKKTPEIIPYCHPLPIDAVDVEFDVAADHIDIRVSVEAVWKTGVEMEALAAVSAAALTIYDMLKPIDTNIVIENIRLDSKKGGKKTYPRRAPADLKAAVVVTSDGTFSGEREDRSGRAIQERLESYGIEARCEILPDDKSRIAETLLYLCDQKIDLVLTTGGTGLGPRDVTAEATAEVIERAAPGIVEAARSYGQARTPYAMLSRGIAGVRGNTLIVNLPGSTRGVEETMDAIFPGVFHAFSMMEGEGH